MSKLNMFAIDPEKLKAEFSERSLSMKQASVALGHAPCYFERICNRRAIPKHAMFAIEEKYGIRYDSYSAVDVTHVPKPDPQEDIPTEIIVQEVDYKQLYDTIYEAVYNAVKKAWSE